MPPEFQEIDLKTSEYAEPAHFRWAYKLVQLYCMEFFSKTEKLDIPLKNESRRWGKGDRPEDAKLFALACLGKIYNGFYKLAWLGNYVYGPVFIIVDEVSRGFRDVHRTSTSSCGPSLRFRCSMRSNVLNFLTCKRMQAFHYARQFLHDGLDMFDEVSSGLALRIRLLHDDLRLSQIAAIG